MPFQTDTTQAATCDALLIKSNRIYQEIHDAYQGMINDFASITSENLHLSMDSLNTQFKNALTIEHMISESLTQQQAVTEWTEKLLAQRHSLLSSLHQANHQLTRKAENVKALLRHEMANLTTNRKACNSYKRIDTDRKNVIRHVF